MSFKEEVLLNMQRCGLLATIANQEKILDVLKECSIDDNEIATKETYIAHLYSELSNVECELPAY